jgi:hypothetical protein
MTTRLLVAALLLGSLLTVGCARVAPTNGSTSQTRLCKSIRTPKRIRCGNT